MMSEQLTKSRAEEWQYLKALMECIQFLARQGLPPRGSDHIDDNVTQLLILLSKIILHFSKNYHQLQVQIIENLLTKTTRTNL